MYIGETLFHGDVTFTDSRENFLAFDGVKINYSAERLCEEALWIVPHGLLNEKNIQAQLLDCFDWDGLKVFFATSGDIPFDIFAASFYLLSRYEEYLPHEVDEYGRYGHTNSIAYKEGFLHLPLVNLWMKVFEAGLHKKFPLDQFKIQNSKFKIVPTYDVDIAFSYLHQPLLKNVFGFYRDLLRGKFDEVAERANVYSGRKRDPFDVFDWLDDLHKQYGLSPIYFFLLTEKRKGVDKNIDPHSKGMQDLMKHHSELYTTGIHPSWQSGDSDEVLKTEMKILSINTQKKVDRSRQHYLRMQIPTTYRRLIELGIKDEYSMAYGTVNGFRASYALPFKWYDVENETVRDLTVHSFCYMDSTAVFQLRETEEEALKELQRYFDIVKVIDGEMIILMHNDFLTEQPEWVGWRKMYERFLERNFG